MAGAFNLMRSNDLIWPYVINNYLKGKALMPFDMLYWNADATRVPAANHSFYLRACLSENRLTKGKMVSCSPTRNLIPKTGELLWQQKTNSGIIGMPVAYQVGTQST